MIPTIGTKISGFYFGLIFPFFTQLNILEMEKFSIIRILFIASAVILEVYIVHRMLKKPYTFVVPRMFAINFVAMGFQVIMLGVCAMIFWIFMFAYAGVTFPAVLELPKSIKAYSPEQSAKVIVYPLAVFGFVGAVILFYVRWKVFCKMYTWFDKSANQVSVRKTMLYAVSASYAFWIVVMMVERIFKFQI